MAKKTSKKYLSTYEEDLIWMSYRYCIGRHTIAAHAHAGNIVRNAYGKLNPNRQNFMAFDIRREIESILRWGTTNFYLDGIAQTQDNVDYRPLELYIEFINGKTEDELNSIKSVYCKPNGYEVTKREKGEESGLKFSMFDLTDLFAWMDVASCFDDKSHKTCKVKNPDTGEVSEVEYFESYVQDDYTKISFKKIKVPVVEYVKNPFITVRINEDYIV